MWKQQHIMGQQYMKFLVFVFLVHVMGKSPDICDTGHESLCNSTIEETFQNLFTVLPTQKFLKENCKKIVTQLECVADYRRTCPLPQSEVDINPIRKVNELSSFSQEVCNENSTIRQEYEDHVDCINNHSQEIKQIIRAVINQLVDFWEDYARDILVAYSTRVHKALSCIALPLMKTRAAETITPLCGKEASDFLWKVYGRLVNPNDAECAENDDDEIFQRMSSAFEEFNSSVNSL